MLSGDRRFALPPEADVARLRRHITYGGFLLIDSAEGRAGGGFDESVRRLLAQTLPGELPIRIPDATCCGSRSTCCAARPDASSRRRTSKASSATAGWRSSTRRTISAARWRATASAAGSTRSSRAATTSARRRSGWAINLVMYALCLDYKTEQAHIDYILRTRRLPR